MGKFNDALENALGTVFKNKLKDCKMSESLMGKSIMLYGDNGCVDKDTEYFNGTEWKKISEYSNGEQVLQYDLETKTASLVQPLRYIKELEEELYHFESKYGLNQTLSGDHRVIYETRKGVLKECTMLELYEKHNNSERGLDGKFLTTFNYEGEGLSLSDDEIRLKIAIMADAYFPLRKTTNYCVFRLKKERKQKRLEMLLNSLKIDYKKTIEESGFNVYRFHTSSKEKKFEQYWYKANKHQMEIIVEEIIKWDGSRDSEGRRRYYSTNKQDADFIQFACATCGLRASIREDNRAGEQITGKKEGYCHKKVGYEVQISNKIKPLLGGYSRNIAEMPVIEKVKSLDGYKYCFTVPTGALVLRRENKIFITGNCGKTKIASELCDNVIFLNCENGLNAIGNAKYININSWTEFTEILDRLENKNLINLIEQGEELAVVIDGVDTLNLYCQRYIAAKHGCKTIGSIPHGVGWDEYKKEAHTQMARFGRLPYLKVQLLHAKEINLEPDMSKPKRLYYNLDLDDRFKGASLKDTDIVCYLSGARVGEAGNQILSSGIFVKTEENFARCKYMSFPPVIEEVSAKKIKEALKEAIEEEMEVQGVKSHNVIDIMNDQAKEDNREHDDLIQELKQIWVALEEDDKKFAKFSDLIREEIGEEISISETNSSHDEALKSLIRRANKLIER